MGIKLQDPSKMQTPAPNNYNPDANPTLKKTPGYSMGTKLKSELDINNKEQKPGPGAYSGDNNVKKTGPMYGFGSSQKGVKDSKSKSLTPGPGHYHIPYTVSDVPDYQNARNPDYKYI